MGQISNHKDNQHFELNENESIVYQYFCDPASSAWAEIYNINC